MFFQSFTIELLYLVVYFLDLFDLSKFGIVRCHYFFYFERALSQILPGEMFGHFPLEELLSHEAEVEML